MIPGRYMGYCDGNTFSKKFIKKMDSSPEIENIDLPITLACHRRTAWRICESILSLWVLVNGGRKCLGIFDLTMASNLGRFHVQRGLGNIF